MNNNYLAKDTKIWHSSRHYRKPDDLSEKGKPIPTTGFDMNQKEFVHAKASAKPAGRQKTVIVDYTIHGLVNRNATITCSPEQEFLTCREPALDVMDYHNKELAWIKASDLQPGTRLVAEDAFITIVSVNSCVAKQETVTLDAPDTHTAMIYGGVIVKTQ